MSKNFVDFLNQELRRKQKTNNAYSMRSFAKFLNIDSGSLSAILNRKIPLTLKRFEKLALYFDLSSEQLQAFREDVQQLQTFPVAFKLLEDDQIIALSKPYYSVIMHLFDLAIFENDINWMARATGMTLEKCQEALDDLIQWGLIYQNSCGEYFKLADNISLLGGKSPGGDEALKNLMKDYYLHSYECIDKVAKKDRLHSGTILSIKRADLPAISEQLRGVRAKILNSQNKSSDKDDVYLLGMSLVPMTGLRKNNEGD